jgi:hypothetical protein
MDITRNQTNGRDVEVFKRKANRIPLSPLNSNITQDEYLNIPSKRFRIPNVKDSSPVSCIINGSSDISSPSSNFTQHTQYETGSIFFSSFQILYIQVLIIYSLTANAILMDSNLNNNDTIFYESQVMNPNRIHFSPLTQGIKFFILIF